LLSSN